MAKHNENCRKNWDVINAFIEEDALADFISGLNEPYFGYAQAARPKEHRRRKLTMQRHAGTSSLNIVIYQNTSNDDGVSKTAN